jgi:hypothetical protein
MQPNKAVPVIILKLRETNLVCRFTIRRANLAHLLRERSAERAGVSASKRAAEISSRQFDGNGFESHAVRCNNWG